MNEQQQERFDVLSARYEDLAQRNQFGFDTINGDTKLEGLRKDAFWLTYYWYFWLLNPMQVLRDQIKDMSEQDIGLDALEAMENAAAGLYDATNAIMVWIDLKKQAELAGLSDEQATQLFGDSSEDGILKLARNTRNLYNQVQMHRFCVNPEYASSCQEIARQVRQAGQDSLYAAQEAKQRWLSHQQVQ